MSLLKFKQSNMDLHFDLKTWNPFPESSLQDPRYSSGEGVNPERTACILEFFLNVFTEFTDKIFVITVKGLKPATHPPLVLETTAQTAQARHM